MTPLLALSTLAHGQVANLGTETIGTASSPASVTLTFNTSATLGSISVVTKGAASLDFANANTGTCATGTGYSSADTCTVGVTFTPSAAGARYGSVVLQDGSGNVIANTYLQGSGTGPQVTFLPGTETAVTSTPSGPGTVAVDGSGNVYVADINNNRILKEAFSAGSYTESTVSTSSLNNPYAVSLDSAGNLYIADTANNRILKETLAAGTYTESTVSTSSLNYPTDVAADASGNIYVVDFGNNRVLIETPSAGGYTETPLTTSALNQPNAIAVDAVGTLYIADSGNNRVLIETPSAGSYTETTMTTSPLSYPGAIRVDGNGNVYIADTFNLRVLKETPSAGSYTETAVSSSTLNYPYGLAIDSGGSIYIADTFNNRILKEDLADPPSLTFAATSQGSTSSPQTVTIGNYGNSGLNFTALSYAADFPESSPNPASDCSATTSLASNATCTLTIDFAPVAPLVGTSAQLTEGVTATTNTLNVSGTSQTVIVTGTETH